MSTDQESRSGPISVAVPGPSLAARYTVAIVGPPNSGKSTLFNRLTGLHQKVANFPGVTVEQRTGRARVSGREVQVIDLPGLYSLEPRSEDERVACDVLHGRMKGVAKPDAILLILDATNLARHLVLAAPVLALGIPTLVILNMADELRRRGGRVDVEALARQLGAPVALVSAAKGEGLEPVFEFLSGAFGVPAPLELPVLQDVPRCRQWAGRVGERAGYHPPAPPLWTRRLDAVLLHPVAGPVIFALVVLAVFQSIFSWARPLMDAVQGLVLASGAWVEARLPESPLRALLVEGVWGGVGSVVVFLPQILLLFLFIGILEDSGYLARAALIADRTMARVGLQGKSFIPLLSAYACAVPAILATRTIENKRDRIATILIAPFMTCSARLPVYTLIIAAFLPEQPLLGPFLGTRAAALLGLYALGFFAAVATARVLKSSILKSERTPFLLEMPPYRWPTLQSLGLRLLDRSKIFLRRAGTVILCVAILLWILAHLPFKDGRPVPIQESVAGTLGRAIEPLIEPLGFNWKIGIGLITSLAAREVIVGTLGTIYGIEGDARSAGLQAALRQDLTPGGAVALLVFFAFAMQCMSTVAVVRRETAGWRWPALQFLYMGSLAYASAFVAHRLVNWWAAA
ncbi:MAG: ferrous iron transporter B [Bryobacterales bacterium]|nr:ferrous iron transporter B [Bryobacteraceae bacterium]MDW8355421.1 ferrous iron transporter B [Bryobacterales bacterium]